MKVLVTASGTGGHLFPAKYLIETLKKRGLDVFFVGSGRRLESEILEDTAVELFEIPAVGLKNRGLRGLWQFFRSFPRALATCRKIFREQSPDVVVGFGGYATFFPVLYARLTGVPSWIHEAELSPGMANAVLCKIANVASVAFPSTNLPTRKSKIRFTGHPVREELLQNLEREPVEIPSRVLILGGSQGANSLDGAVEELLPFLRSNKISLWHQCRRENEESLKELFEKAGVEVRLQSFIKDLPDAYRWAHVIISRAGAGTVMELGVVGKPALLVPYPHAQGNHQLFNAKLLADAGKAKIVEEGDGFVSRLREALFDMLKPEIYREMFEKAAADRPQNATEAIADGLVELVEEA